LTRCRFFVAAACFALGTAFDGELGGSAVPDPPPAQPASMAIVKPAAIARAFIAPPG
jgi:hypothetical protein